MNILVVCATIGTLVLYSTIQGKIMLCHSERIAFLFVYLILWNRICAIFLILLVVFIFSILSMAKCNGRNASTPYTIEEALPFSATNDENDDGGGGLSFVPPPQRLPLPSSSLKIAASLAEKSPFGCFLISLANIAATACQYQSLVYIPLSFQSIGKCTKILPTLVLRSMMFGSLPSLADLIICLVVLMGVFLLFIFPSYEIVYGSMGFLLIFVHSILDSLTMIIQEKMLLFKINVQHRTLGGSLGVLLIQSVSGLAISIIISLMLLPYDPNGWVLFSSIPWTLLFGLSLSSTFSQLLVLISIQRLTSIGHVLIMTCRHLFVIVASEALLHQDTLVCIQWIGVMMVIGALFLKAILSQIKKPTPHIHPKPLN